MKKSMIFVGMLSVVYAYAQEGNVGINTDNPVATLDIQPNAANARLEATTNQGIIAPRLSKARIANIEDSKLVEGTLVYATNDEYIGTNTKVSKITEKGYYYYDGTEWVKTSAGTSGAFTNIYNSDGTLSSKRTVTMNTSDLVFIGDGKIGINNTAPEKKLDVLGDIRVVGSNDHLIRLQREGDDKVTDLMKRTNGTFIISNGSTARESISMTTSGNVGIGTVSPTVKLDVSGEIRANAVNYNSDVRLKTDIKEINNATFTINGLRSVTYIWNELGRQKGGSEKLQYGFLAQEVEKILPPMVNTDSEGYKSVNYTALIPVLVKALQEKDKELTVLKAEVEAIKKALRK